MENTEMLLQEKFDLNNIHYQDSITISNIELIKDFYDSHISYWREDIINFNNLYNKFEVKNAIKLIIWISDYYENKIVFSSCYLLKDNSKVHLNIKYEDMINWLQKFELIIK